LSKCLLLGIESAGSGVSIQLIQTPDDRGRDKAEDGNANEQFSQHEPALARERAVPRKSEART
jgi:hypothetical protein